MYVLKNERITTHKKPKTFSQKKSWIVYIKIMSQFATTFLGDSDITH